MDKHSVEKFTIERILNEAKQHVICECECDTFIPIENVNKNAGCNMCSATDHLKKSN